MTWVYQSNEITELPYNCIGFVYIITNLTNNKKYIGKKLAQFSKTKYQTVKLKNGTKKKKKIKFKIQSDWQDYWSSSEELQADVKALGQANFKREILKYCKSKNELSYYEAKYQFDYGVLLEDSSWYNKWISVKVRTLEKT